MSQATCTGNFVKFVLLWFLRYTSEQTVIQRDMQTCYQFRRLVNRGTMVVNSSPKTVTRQRLDCDLNPGASGPESSTLTTRLPSLAKPLCTCICRL